MLQRDRIRPSWAGNRPWLPWPLRRTNLQRPEKAHLTDPANPFLFAMASATPAWHVLRHLLWFTALIGSLTSTVFLGMVLFAAVRYAMTCRSQRPRVLGVPLRELPPVTILKPLHGREARLEENLESFFQQDYPNFEIVFGARSPEDQALGVVDKRS